MKSPHTLYRCMQPADLGEVIRIENAVFDHPWPAEAFESDAMKDSYVLEKSGIVIGYIMCLVAMDECTIANIAVAPEHQNQGYGRLILSETFELMRSRGIAFYYLDVRESNTIAQKLYTNLGFRRIALRKNYYSHPDENAVVMCLDTQNLNQG
ncbi:MAG: ribosomal protein S18-alanine N-acetyltransferase [Candidatus Cloacimonadaceae bacterium]|nr:ribosomal protein S18-alanine N-acetyltransferase [Candidatus Cloacimonadaceae bacterium]